MWQIVVLFSAPTILQTRKWWTETSTVIVIFQNFRVPHTLPEQEDGVHSCPVQLLDDLDRNHGAPEQMEKALHQQLSGMGEVKRRLYSSPNNCWMQNHHHAGHQALEEEREVAAMKNLWSQALEVKR